MNKENNENGGFVVNVYSSGNQLIHSQVNNYYGTVYQGGTKPASEGFTDGVKKSLLDYVVRLMPVVSDDYKNSYMDIWQEILAQDLISKVIYERGSQKGTIFNRNLVARISHMFVLNGIIAQKTSDTRLAELLEPERGKKHPVRGELALSPEDKLVKQAVAEVLEKHKK